jgi:hypothetical protein
MTRDILIRANGRTLVVLSLGPADIRALTQAKTVVRMMPVEGRPVDISLVFADSPAGRLLRAEQEIERARTGEGGGG